MSAEERNSLFSEDLSMMAGDISEMVGEETQEEQVDTPEQTEDTTEGSEQDTNEIDQENQQDFNLEEDDEEDKGESSEDNEESDGEDAPSENDDDTKDSPSLAPYAKLLVDEGILPNLDLEKFDGSPEGLIEAARSEVYNGINHYKETLPQDIQKLINGYEAGVPFQKLLEFNSEDTKYSQIDEDTLVQDENLQRKILKDYYQKTSRFSEEKINKLIDRSADLGELAEEATGSLKELTEFQNEEQQHAIDEAKKEQERLQETQKEQLENFNKTLESTEEIIPGVKINPTLKQKIQKNITTPVAYDEQGNPVNKIGKYRGENPIDFEIKLNYIFEATKGFTDFEVFTKSGKSKAYKELEDASRNLDKRGNSGQSGKVTGDPEVNESINYFMNQMK